MPSYCPGLDATQGRVHEARLLPQTLSDQAVNRQASSLGEVVTQAPGGGLLLAQFSDQRLDIASGALPCSEVLPQCGQLACGETCHDLLFSTS